MVDVLRTGNGAKINYNRVLLVLWFFIFPHNNFAYSFMLVIILLLCFTISSTV